MSWVPDTNPPYEYSRTSSEVCLVQSFKWTSQQLQELHDIRQGYDVDHEVRRCRPGTVNNYNCWNFLYACGWFGLWCCCHFLASVPNPDPWHSEEADLFISCLTGIWPRNDEEGEIKIGGTEDLQADLWYYIGYYFRRRSGEKGNKVRTLWEFEIAIYSQGPPWITEQTADVEFDT